MDKPKKLILDYSKWRCGMDGGNSLGYGETALLNNKGFMCCLGQFGKQCGVPDNELFERGDPSECETSVPLFEGSFVVSAININDDEDTTPEAKLNAIETLLREEGIELEVINKP